MKYNLPDCFYRISVKALILNDERDKFLIVQEDNGRWDIPGGGLEWGRGVKEELAREIMEEMGLQTTFIADNPSYFVNDRKGPDYHCANVIYETEVDSYEFTPSEECVDIRFVSAETIEGLDVYENIEKLAVLFNPLKHRLS